VIQGKCWWTPEGTTQFQGWDQIWFWRQHIKITRLSKKLDYHKLSHSSLWNQPILWFFNSSFQVLWKSILCFMFHCWNIDTHHLPSQISSIKLWITYLIMDVFYCFEMHDQMYHYGGSKYTLFKICPFIQNNQHCPNNIFCILSLDFVNVNFQISSIFTPLREQSYFPSFSCA